MVDNDSSEIPPTQPAGPGPRCPWCSAPIANADEVTCPSCGATLRGDAAIEVPGVTSIDVLHVIRAAPPHKVRGSLGSLFVGGDEIAPPTEAELPALAMPDPGVRREMLRLRLDAELIDLTARAEALAAERGLDLGMMPEAAPDIPPAAGTGDGEGAGPAATPDTAAPYDAAPADPAAPYGLSRPEDSSGR